MLPSIQFHRPSNVSLFLLVASVIIPWVILNVSDNFTGNCIGVGICNLVSLIALIIARHEEKIAMEGTAGRACPALQGLAGDASCRPSGRTDIVPPSTPFQGIAEEIVPNQQISESPKPELTL